MPPKRGKRQEKRNKFKEENKKEYNNNNNNNNNKKLEYICEQMLRQMSFKRVRRSASDYIGWK